MTAAFVRLMKRENKLFLNMCLFVDKIFQIMRSTGGNDQRSLGGEIVDNYYLKGDSVWWI